jgi:hypothetical protein
MCSELLEHHVLPISPCWARAQTPKGAMIHGKKIWGIYRKRGGKFFWESRIDQLHQAEHCAPQLLPNHLILRLERLWTPMKAILILSVKFMDNVKGHLLVQEDNCHRHQQIPAAWTRPGRMVVMEMNLTPERSDLQSYLVLSIDLGQLI